MSASLLRRMVRLEAALRPKPEQGFTVLLEPDTEATDTEWQEHRRAIKAARLRGDRVGIVRSSGSVERDQSEPGVEYFENEFHAWLAVMVSQKSQQGRANRLADILASLSGNIFRPVKE